MKHPTRPPGLILEKMGKYALLLRLLCAYPILLALTQDPGLVKILLFAFTLLCSLALLLAWHRLAGLIQAHPALMAVDALAALGIFAATGGHVSYLAYLGSTALLIGLVSGTVGRVLLLTLLAIGYIAVVLTAGMYHPEAVAPRAAAVLGGVLLIVAIGVLGGNMRELQDLVARALEAARASSRQAALGEERSRIAREMHDSLVKTMVGIDLQAKAMALSGEGGSGPAAISQSAQQAIAESRRLMTDLRGGAVPPLSTSLRVVADELQAHYQVTVEVDIEPDVDVEPDQRYALLKIAEEALTNAARHSGTRTISCRVSAEADSVRLVVVDRGTGMGARELRAGRAGHFGLAGMRERALHAGGVLDIDSRPVAGTRVTVSLPRRLQEVL